MLIGPRRSISLFALVKDSPDDGDAPALTFAQPLGPAEVEEDEEEQFGRYSGSSSAGGGSWY